MTRNDGKLQDKEEKPAPNRTEQAAYCLTAAKLLGIAENDVITKKSPVLFNYQWMENTIMREGPNTSIIIKSRRQWSVQFETRTCGVVPRRSLPYFIAIYHSLFKPRPDSHEVPVFNSRNGGLTHW